MPGTHAATCDYVVIFGLYLGSGVIFYIFEVAGMTIAQLQQLPRWTTAQATTVQVQQLPQSNNCPSRQLPRYDNCPGRQLPRHQPEWYIHGELGNQVPRKFVGLGNFLAGVLQCHKLIEQA